MTDHIDLDELAEEVTEADERNHGDWLWRGTGDPDGEPDPDSTETVDTIDRTGGRVPRVPYEDGDKPVGVPNERGGAGGAAAGAERDDGGARPGTPAAGTPSSSSSPSTPDAPDAGGTGPAEGGDGPGGEPTDTERVHARGGGEPHGGADDMTLVMTYRAMRSLSDPAAVSKDAARWADWVGIVGDVSAHVIKKFQRDEFVEADFFNGASMGPVERLVDVDRESMFFAERQVVVGLPDERWIAEEADWEFVTLAEAAGKAGWTLTEEADAESRAGAGAGTDEGGSGE